MSEDEKIELYISRIPRRSGGVIRKNDIVPLDVNDSYKSSQEGYEALELLVKFNLIEHSGDSSLGQYIATNLLKDVEFDGGWIAHKERKAKQKESEEHEAKLDRKVKETTIEQNVSQRTINIFLVVFQGISTVASIGALWIAFLALNDSDGKKALLEISTHKEQTESIIDSLKLVIADTLHPRNAQKGQKK